MADATEPTEREARAPGDEPPARDEDSPLEREDLRIRENRPLHLYTRRDGRQ